MGLYDYGKIFKEFPQILQANSHKAILKKGQYLERIITIFTQFVKKCQKQIDCIITRKIDQLSNNYEAVKEYMETNKQVLSQQEQKLIIAEFLIKPFERFPFSGNKNQKIFKQQYNLIQKASVLIEQTLVDSFNEDQVPTFSNQRFFQTLRNHGIGEQSITKIRLNSQTFQIKSFGEIKPKQSSAKSIKMIQNGLMVVIGDSRGIQIWDIQNRTCLKQLFVQVRAPISCLYKYQWKDKNLLMIGFGDECPQIWGYRMDNWNRYSHNITHTRKITKLLQANEYLISGSADGNICVHSINPFKTKIQAPHVSPIEDIIKKNTYIYLLLKCSTVCQYELLTEQLTLQFRRTLSAGYISMIRYPQLTSNFAGVACHIYGLSQIEITRKFKIEQTNIINVVEMISDFVVLQSKETSEFFAVCVFQNSSTIRIYSLLSQQLTYEFACDDLTEVGVAGYLPKLEIAYCESGYILALIVLSQLQNQPNTIKLYRLIL